MSNTNKQTMQFRINLIDWEVTYYWWDQHLWCIVEEATGMFQPGQGETKMIEVKGNPHLSDILQVDYLTIELLAIMNELGERPEFSNGREADEFCDEQYEYFREKFLASRPAAT